METVRYVIVQAGGKGTRLNHLTWNKPKCLVSVYGKPLLYSISNAFPGSKVLIRTDYKREVLIAYLKAFPPDFKYEVVTAEEEGTNAGLQKAIDLIPDNSPFAIVWSDLYFNSPVKIPGKRSYIGITDRFECRWSMSGGVPVNKKSTTTGIIGLFYFHGKESLPKIPESGEICQYLLDNGVKMEPLMISNVDEIGTLDKYYEAKSTGLNQRHYNSLEIKGGAVTKTAIDPDYAKYLDYETNWYRFVSDHGYRNIPNILGLSPLRMEFVKGKQPHHLAVGPEGKREIMEEILVALDDLHGLGSTEYSEESSISEFVGTTEKRIEKISTLIPNSDTEQYTVNGRRVMNILNPKYSGRIRKLFEKTGRSESFAVIHGDPTFSNTIIEEGSGRVVFIDPRGYFGKLKIYGDPMYDFVKLYSSAVHNFSTFNERKFTVKVDGKSVELKIASEGWEDSEKVMAQHLGARSKDLSSLDALRWLSFSGVCTDDIDSIIASYFHGLSLFQKAWDQYD